MKTLIETCYIDDVVDTELSQYLKNYVGIHNRDCVPSKDDDAASLINMIVEGGCRIVIIDSDLANGQNPLLTTGQQVELLLTQRYPFIFVIVMTSHLESGYDQYIKKYNSRVSRATKETATGYYDRVLKPVLDFALNKYIRNTKTVDTELTEEKGIGSSERAQIVSSFSNDSQILMSKDDLDRIFNLFEEIKESHENK